MSSISDGARVGLTLVCNFSLPLLLFLHRSRHLSLQKVGGEGPTSSAPSARLSRLRGLHLHHFLLLPPLLLSLLQRLWLSLPSLPVPLLLLRAPAHLLRFGGPVGRGGGEPESRKDPPQAQAQPQLATRALGKPPEGVGLQLGATAAGSVRQQRVYGVKPRREGTPAAACSSAGGCARGGGGRVRG